VAAQAATRWAAPVESVGKRPLAAAGRNEELSVTAQS